MNNFDLHILIKIFRHIASIQDVINIYNTCKLFRSVVFHNVNKFNIFNHNMSKHRYINYIKLTKKLIKYDCIWLIKRLNLFDFITCDDMIKYTSLNIVKEIYVNDFSMILTKFV